MRVTLLVDNEASSNVLRSEHGLSFLIETGDHCVLFDTGQSDAWLHNLLALGHSLDSIKSVSISHGHYDHTGGLPAAIQQLPGATFRAHPACFEPRYTCRSGELRYIGMPAKATSHKAAFRLNRSAVEALPGVSLSGEIPLRVVTDPSDGRFAMGTGELRQDTFEDEQCVIVRHGSRVAVLVGCSHRGVENNVLAAMDVASVGRIDLLVGGFHLGSADEAGLESLSAFLESTDIGEIACCHCTGFGAYDYLRSNVGSRVTRAKAGLRWEI